MCCSHDQLLFVPRAIFPYMRSCDPRVWPRDKYRNHTGAHRTAALIQHHECVRVFIYILWRLHRQLSFSSIGCCEIAAVQSRPPWLQNPDAGAGVYSCDVSPGHELVCNGNWSSGLAPASCARRPRLNSHRCSTLRGKLSVS